MFVEKTFKMRLVIIKKFYFQNIYTVKLRFYFSHKAKCKKCTKQENVKLGSNRKQAFLVDKCTKVDQKYIIFENILFFVDFSL